MDFYIKEDNKNTNKTLLYRNGILEENFKLSSALFDIGLDTINVKRIINNRETKVLNNSSAQDVDLVDIVNEISTLSEREQILWESFYMDYAFRTPIYKRTTNEEIRELLETKLKAEDIDLDFEFAIYSNNLATKISSEDFKIENNDTFSLPIFDNENDDNNYRLLVNFPKRERYMFSSIYSNLLFVLNTK